MFSQDNRVSPFYVISPLLVPLRPMQDLTHNVLIDQDILGQALYTEASGA